MPLSIAANSVGGEDKLQEAVARGEFKKTMIDGVEFYTHRVIKSGTLKEKKHLRSQSGVQVCAEQFAIADVAETIKELNFDVVFDKTEQKQIKDHGKDGIPDDARQKMQMALDASSKVCKEMEKHLAELKNNSGKYVERGEELIMIVIIMRLSRLHQGYDDCHSSHACLCRYCNDYALYQEKRAELLTAHKKVTTLKNEILDMKMYNDTLTALLLSTCMRHIRDVCFEDCFDVFRSMPRCIYV